MSTDTENAPIVEVTGSATLDEYLESNRFWYLQSTTARKFRYLIFIRYGYLIGGVLLAIGIATTYAIISSPATGASSNWFWASGDWIAPLLCGLGVYWLILPISYRRRLKKRYKQADVGCGFTAKFDADGIYTARLDGNAESKIKWERFQYWEEGPGLFLFCPSKSQYAWIPKRLLKPGDEEKLRELLAAKIPADKDNS